MIPEYQQKRIRSYLIISTLAIISSIFIPTSSSSNNAMRETDNGILQQFRTRTEIVELVKQEEERLIAGTKLPPPPYKPQTTTYRKEEKAILPRKNLFDNTYTLFSENEIL